MINDSLREAFMENIKNNGEGVGGLRPNLKDWGSIAVEARISSQESETTREILRGG